jgi:hypothetical protein
MKVVAYLWSNPPYRYTGAELMTLDLLQYLIEDGNEVAVYSHAVDDAMEWNGIRIESSGRLHRGIALKSDVFITLPEIRTNVWDYVRGMPYVGIVHNVQGGTMRSLDRCPPTLTLVNSEYTRTHVPQVAVHHGLGVHVVHPPVLIQPKDGPHDRYGMVNMSLEKGGHVLNLVASQVSKARFVGVLGGHGIQVTHQPANVEVMPPTNDMAGVYSRMRALLFPTHSETYGKVVAEAMVCGVPVIASDLPGVREAGGDAALYLDPYAYDDWMDAVRMMQDDDAHAKWVGKAKERGLQLVAANATNAARYISLIRAAAE